MYHSSFIEEDQVQRYRNIFIILYYMCEKQNTCFLEKYFLEYKAF